MSAKNEKTPEYPAPMGSIWTRPDLTFGANWVASGDAAVQETFLNDLTEEELLALPFLFEFWAAEHQLPPGGDWRNWVIMGGRGAGKTRAGAEWVRSMVEGARPMTPGRATRVALVAETIDQAREVMVFGESGILASSPPDRRPRYEATRKRLVWDNGAEARLFSAHDPEALRGPQFDAAWCDEFGCAAIDKGTNQPNKFLDPKSSESGLPHYSKGNRDEVLQRQYFRAMLRHWKDPFNNPMSSLYDGSMIDMDHAYAWAWDARPYPAFPNNQSLWTDAENYKTGHWLNGRAASRSVGDAISEICADAGIQDVDTEGAYGIVRGVISASGDTGRAALQPILLTHGIDASEQGGQLVFGSRHAHVDQVVATEKLVAAEDGDLVRIRSSENEENGIIRVGFVEADGSFDLAWEEASLSETSPDSVAINELPLALTRSEGRLIAERWLAEARVSRDRVNFVLPHSFTGVAPGRVLRLENGELVRVERVDVAEELKIEAVRVDPEAYSLARIEEDVPKTPAFVPPLPVNSLFLDLPLLSGDEVPHAPHVAASARPWPGNVAVYKQANDGGFDLNVELTEAATMGVTENALKSAKPGVFDLGDALQVRLNAGTLQSTDLSGMLSGANQMAIGSGNDGKWEVFQFADAELIADQTYLLKKRLRGLNGTDAFVPDVWPTGSQVVLLTPALAQLDLKSSSRTLAGTYRIGAVNRPLDDAAFTEHQVAFSGVGLRPYSPAHLDVQIGASDHRVSWMRRSRIAGEAWDIADIPLGEESESYLLYIRVAGQIVRTIHVAQTNRVYSANERAADGATDGYEIEVAQVSAIYGPGGASHFTVPAI